MEFRPAILLGALCDVDGSVSPGNRPCSSVPWRAVAPRPNPRPPTSAPARPGTSGSARPAFRPRTDGLPFWDARTLRGAYLAIGFLGNLKRAKGFASNRSTPRSPETPKTDGRTLKSSKVGVESSYFFAWDQELRLQGRAAEPGAISRADFISARSSLVVSESRREKPGSSVRCFRGAAHRLERSGLQRLNAQ